MSDLVIAGNTSGTVTLSAPDVAGPTVLTLPNSSGTVITDTNLTSSLSSSFPSSLSSSGYQKLSSGLIVQWGVSGSISSGGSIATITLPITFASEIYAAYLTGTGNYISTAGGIDTVRNLTVSSFEIVHGSAGTRTFYWYAIGV